MLNPSSASSFVSRRKFLASAVAAATAIRCAPLQAAANLPVWRHVLFTGQSLTIGKKAMFSPEELANGDNRTTSGRAFMVRPPTVGSTSGAAISPLPRGLRKFQTLDQYEPALGMANILSRYSNIAAPEVLLINTSAQEASAYSAIKRGGTLPFVYDRLIQYATEAKRLSLLSSVQYSVAAVCVCHGETDMSINAIGAMTEDQLRLAYFSSLQEWRTDFSNDFSTLEVPVEGGQGVRMLLYQMSTWRRSTVAGTQNQNGNAGVTLAQLDAHEAGTHVVVAPTYAFEHFDHFHLTRTGYQQLGEMFMAALNAESAQPGNWRPLRPLTVTNPRPAQVDIQMQGGVLPYRFEALPVQPSFSAPKGFVENNGFTVRSPDRRVIPITRITIVGDTIRIITGRIIPPGSTVSYGLGTHVNNQSMGGNLRDSSVFPTRTGGILRHWCLLFKKLIPSPVAS